MWKYMTNIDVYNRKVHHEQRFICRDMITAVTQATTIVDRYVNKYSETTAGVGG